MIVRNEEKLLPRCLKSVRPIADQLVVVDTGSQDNTMSVALDFGAMIHEFKWCDDFSAARNAAIKHATGEWILHIDADEELLEKSAKRLRKVLKNPWPLAYMISIDNGPTYAKRFFKSGRLFRNHPRIEYTRAYHETIRTSVDDILASEAGWQILDEPGIVIRHYGYEESLSRDSDKINREIRILESYVKENPRDQAMAIRLAEVYQQAERYDKAVGLCEKILSCNPHNAAAQHVLGTIYWEKGNVNEAFLQFKKALAIDNNMPWVHYHLGGACRARGDLKKAVSEFNKALDLDPHLSKARTALGAVFHSQGMLENAFVEYKKALKTNPKDGEAHFNLGIIHRNWGQLDSAIRAYKEALLADPFLAEAHNNLAIVYFLKKEYKSAIKHCDKAIELGFKVHLQFIRDLKAHRR
ncbi:MAG: tetratricopeptide repeat protein [Deltaproteobacteria bacterium]|nr:tetratricopeptide repeat protein [Deltaproteobacteria bacterium]